MIAKHVMIHGGRGRRLLSAAVAGLVLASCANGRLADFDKAGISKKEYETMLGRHAPAPQARGEEPPIPEMQSVLAAPTAPEFADTRRVSIAVTETTALRDIIIELARQGQVDLELDQRIAGGIIMTATDRPFVEVISRIAELADLRYTLEKNRLHVTVDDPYLQEYRVSVLNLARSTSTSISSSTDASSAAAAIGGGGGGGGSNKSTTSLSASGESDFWKTLSTNLDLILQGIKNRRPLQAAAINAAYVPQTEMEKPADAKSSGQATAAPARGGPGAAQVAQAKALGGRQEQLDSVAKMDQADIATQTSTAAAAQATAAAASGSLGNSEFSINAQAGIITMFATQRQHKAIARYLRDVLDSVNQQVLIEAKVLEVTLSDQYRAGINWSAALGPLSTGAFGRAGGTKIITDFTRNVTTSEIPDPTLSIIASNKQNTLNSAVQLVNQFGTVRSLSNPRLTVVNNQMAMLKVANNQVFFQLQVTTTDSTATSAGKTTVSSQIKTVPVGLVMTVQPAVDSVSGKISLNLRPSITRITGFVQDPGVQLTIAQFNQNNPATAQNISSPIPIIEAREIDSIVTLDSGDTLVMGGLLQDNSQNTREGIPGAMDIPIVGQLVSSNIKSNTVSELVIFLRATLVNDRASVSDEDIRLYKTFAPDPRPVAF